MSRLSIFNGAILFLLAGGFLAGDLEAQSSKVRSTNEQQLPSGIAWYGVLTDGIAEAKATNRPILLLSAAAQCGGVPGMW